MDTTSTQPRTAKFTSLAEASKEDVLITVDEYKELTTPKKLADRAIQMLEAQKGIYGGAQVDLYEHGLQTATRALRDGADEETIVIGLLHDIGEVLSASNHGEIPASILRPYISEKSWWILAHHEIFQGYYYFEHIGGDKNKRDIFKDQEHYQATVDFCAKYDAPSFDPGYKSEPIETFRPMVERVFSKKPFFFNPNHPKAIAVTGRQ